MNRICNGNLIFKNLIYYSSVSLKNSIKSSLFTKKYAIEKLKVPVVRNFTTQGFDSNQQILKDVIVFKYENPKFFKILNIFALCQFLFWNYLSHFAYTTLKDAPVDKDDADIVWWRKINLGDNKFRNAIAIMCFAIGYGIFVVAWMYTLRSVRYLVLRKGANNLSIVTYTPFGKNRIMEVPLKYVSAQESRQAAKVHLPLKVKNKSLFYILDMRGEFLNTRLYDYTVGLRRKF